MMILRIIQSLCTRRLLWVFCALVLLPFRLLAQETGDQSSEEHTYESAEGSVALSVEELKKKVIELNRDLFILEEDLLFPASTQFAVFLSLETGKLLKLDAVKLKVNDDVMASHLYTERQLKALQRGGMQRLHIGNLKTGRHEVTVFVESTGVNNQVYKHAATLEFEKGTGIAALEVRIRDNPFNYQQDVTIVEWD